MSYDQLTTFLLLCNRSSLVQSNPIYIVGFWCSHGGEYEITVYWEVKPCSSAERY
jgi:hypothetical protein